MKRNLFFKVFYLLAAVIMLFNAVAGVYKSLYYDIDELPTGRLVSSCLSPNGKRTLNVYLVQNALGCGIRGEVIKGDVSKNVFWQTNITEVTSSWIDNNTILIDSMQLDVAHGGTYDCRRGQSLFQEGAVDEIFSGEEGD